MIPSVSDILINKSIFSFNVFALITTIKSTNSYQFRKPEKLKSILLNISYANYSDYINI